ncbi:hypothetical protein BTVI_59086 [Pitangus sulphuratus]|nr:hypothetical protein BTVI_59086 [Pitangus sulphuratus]
MSGKCLCDTTEPCVTAAHDITSPTCDRPRQLHVKILPLGETTMKLILVVFLTMVLYRLSLSPAVIKCMAEEWISSIDPCNSQDWVRVRMDTIPKGPKKLPIVAKTMTAECSSTIVLCNPQDWVRVRTDIAPEGLKQSPVVPESAASDLLYPLCQIWNYLAR